MMSTEEHQPGCPGPNMHISNTIQTEQVTAGDAHTHIHITTINEKEAMNVKEGYNGGKEEIMQLYYNLQNN